MPQTTLEEGFQATAEDTIKAALPGWVVRDCATAVHYPGKTPLWKVGFRCDCRTAKDYITVKSKGKTIKQVAAAAHDQIEAKHGGCNVQTTAPAPSKREAQLEAEVISVAKRQKTLERKVSAAEADKGAAAEAASAATKKSGGIPPQQGAGRRSTTKIATPSWTRKASTLRSMGQVQLVQTMGWWTASCIGREAV